MKSKYTSLSNTVHIRVGHGHICPIFLLLMSTNVFVVTLINLRTSMKEFLVYAHYSHSTNRLKFIMGSTKEIILKKIIFWFSSPTSFILKILFDIWNVEIESVILIPIMPYFMTLYDRHNCQKMTFYDIYDRHKMSFPDFKVWQYGYQNNRLDLTI